jgi:hypothetical protein
MGAEPLGKSSVGEKSGHDDSCLIDQASQPPCEAPARRDCLMLHKPHRAADAPVVPQSGGGLAMHRLQLYLLLDSKSR